MTAGGAHKACTAVTQPAPGLAAGAAASSWAALGPGTAPDRLAAAALAAGQQGAPGLAAGAAAGSWAASGSGTAPDRSAVATVASCSVPSAPSRLRFFFDFLTAAAPGGSTPSSPFLDASAPMTACAIANACSHPSQIPTTAGCGCSHEQQPSWETVLACHEPCAVQSRPWRCVGCWLALPWQACITGGPSLACACWTTQRAAGLVRGGGSRHASQPGHDPAGQARHAAHSCEGTRRHAHAHATSLFLAANGQHASLAHSCGRACGSSRLAPASAAPGRGCPPAQCRFAAGRSLGACHATLRLQGSIDSPTQGGPVV